MFRSQNTVAGLGRQFSSVNEKLIAVKLFVAILFTERVQSLARLKLQYFILPAALMLLAAPQVRAIDDYVWWEGESPATSNFPGGSWLSPGNDFERNQLSGANILTAGDRNQPYYAQYNVTVSAAGAYKLYTRRFWSYGAFKWRFDSGEWRFAGTDLQRMDSADYKTYFPLNWVYLGEINLSAGAHTFRIEVNQADWTNENDRNSVDKFGADAFLLSEQSFVPRGKLKPDEKYNLREPGWWNFEPLRDRFASDALLDLSYLNEDVAGQNGFVRRQGDKFVLGDGSPARFWAVTTSNIGSDLASMRQQAKFMAKRGVNLVRFHTTVAASDPNNINAVNQAAVDGAHRMVAAFKQEGIYTKLSNFFVLGFTVRKEWGVDGYTEDKHAPFSVLMFDPKLKAAYKEWMRQMFTQTNPHTGVSLAQDPAVAVIEIQNEDNFFFWTFNPDAFPEAQRQRIDGLFGSYLINKYGSIQNAMNVWGQGAPQWRDAPAAGRMTVQGAWFMTPAYTGDPKRMADQIQFLTELQRNFYVEMRDYFRNSLGSGSLIEASNWTTADERTLQDVERYTYTATDVIDKHHYFGGVHTDPNGENSSGYAVNEGDYFQSAATVKDPRALPTGYKQVAGFPNIISESTWTNPNRFKAEGPLLVAAYGSMADIDGFVWFATGSLAYEDDVNKFPSSVPSLMGQFPGAALLYRRGDVTETSAVRDERNLQKMYAKELSLISESAKYDPNRNSPSDPPYNPTTGVGQLDTLAMLVGKVEGNYTNSDLLDYVAPNLLSRIDLTTKNVRSLPTATRANGELQLDWNRGLFRVDTPRSQGVTGFLSTDSNANLTDVAIASTNEFGAVLVIALDNKPIRESNKILIQAMTEDAPYGWRETDQTFVLDGVTYNGKRIASKGQAPMNVREIAATVTLKGLGQGAAPIVTVLDENGYARNAGSGTVVGGDFRVTLPTDALYTIVTRPTAPPPGGNGTGLRGEYFDNADLTNLVTTRTDATVDFDYGSGAPVGTAVTSGDTFSARWTGQIEAPVAGNYTFTTTSDDGVRLWVNDQLLIDNWTLHAPTDNSGTIQLAAGRHNIRMEFYENNGGAVARLAWAYPGTPRQVVPQMRLYPPNATPPTSDWTLCAGEGQQCAFTGTKEVRYGANGQYAFRTLTGGTACANSVFGDPLVGTVKQCWYRPPTVSK